MENGAVLCSRPKPQPRSRCLVKQTSVASSTNRACHRNDCNLTHYTGSGQISYFPPVATCCKSILCTLPFFPFIRLLEKKCAFFLSSAARSDLDLAPPGPKAENGTATTGRRVCCRPWVCSLNFSTCRTILLRCVPSVPPGGLFVASQQHPATVSFAWRVLFNAGVYGPFDERSGCRC